MLCLDGRMDRQASGKMGGWMDGGTDTKRDRQADKHMDGCMEVYMHGIIGGLLCVDPSLQGSWLFVQRLLRLGCLVCRASLSSRAKGSK